MMKFSYATNLGAAIVLLVPAVALQSGGARSLEESLKSTVDALEQFTAIEKRVEAKDPTAVADVLKFTEPPMADEKTRDARRDTLRDAIGELQAEFDSVDPSGAPRVGDDSKSPRKSSIDSRSSRKSNDDEKSSGKDARTAFEPHGYIADTTRLAKTFYRQARYEEAILILGDTSKDAEAGYWKGRCLEKIGHDDEARIVYAQVVAIAKGHDADRAKEALDFLDWRSKFQKKPASAPTAKKNG